MIHFKVKSIISVLVVCVMLLCSVTAFASPKDEFNKLSTQEITKAAFTYDFGIKLDEPLSAALDETGEISAVLGNLMFHAYGKMDMSDDYQQMKMQMTMEMPEFAASIPEAPDKIDIWMDMDLTDAENPTMIMIMTDPVSGKYGYMDYTAIPGMMDVYASMMDVNQMQKLNQELLESVDLPEDAYTETEDGYRLTMTGEQLMEGFGAVMKLMGNYMITTMGTATSPDSANTAEFEKAIEELGGMLSGVKLFGEPAVVLDYTVDDNGGMTGMDMQMAIDTNIVDLMGAFGVTDMPIAREDANIKATFSMAMDFTNIGEAQEIALPELTAENSVDMLYIPEATATVYDMNAINVVADGTLVTFPDARPVLENDRTFVPVRAISNIFGIADENITYADGVVTIVDGAKTITLTEGVTEVSVTENGNEIKLVLDVAPFNREDRVYVPLRFVNDALGGTTEWGPLYGNGTEMAATGSVVTITTQKPVQEGDVPVVKPAVRVLVPASETELSDAVKTAATDAGIVCEVVGAEDASYVEKTMLVLAAGENMMIFVPDAQAEQIGEFFDTHAGQLLADLTDVVDADALTDEQKAAIAGEDGKIYAYPVEGGAFIIPQTVEILEDYTALLQALNQ